MMRVLTYLSIITILALSSCSTLKNTVRIGRGGENSLKVVPHVIDTLKDAQIFELQMKYKEDEFSGLLI